MKSFFALAVFAAVSFVSAQQTVKVDRTIPPGGDVTILQYALTLEHLEAFFYKQAVARFSAKDFQRAGYPPFVRERVVLLSQQEANHVSFLETGLSAAGVTPTAACEYSFPYNTVDEFLALSRVLENVGVSAYLGAASDISLAAYVTAAGAILTVEARHQAVISEVQGVTGFPSPYDTPLKYSNVYTLASQFITKCPPTNPSLPVSAFPALSVVTKNPAPGASIDLKFDPKGLKNGQLYMHVLNGLNDIVVPISARGHSRLPKNIAGFVYLVVSSSADALTDKNTIAGPAILQLYSSGENWELKHGKPAHHGAKKPCKKGEKKDH